MELINSSKNENDETKENDLNKNNIECTRCGENENTLVARYCLKCGESLLK